MKFLNLLKFIIPFALIHYPNILCANELNDLLKSAYKNNPKLRGVHNKIEAEKSLVISSFTLDDPMVGISTLDRNMKTRYLTVNQSIRFPYKYVLQKNIQKRKVDTVEVELANEKLKLREKIISIYYSIFSIQKTIELTKINMQAVKEFARVAEKKYASGRSTQGDSMKAHFELTHLEVELIALEQEESALQEKLKSLVNDQGLSRINLENIELKVPVIGPDQIPNDHLGLKNKIKEKSILYQKEVSYLNIAKARSILSSWEFAPDIKLQFQQRISGMPHDSKIFGIGITIPLWFWKKSSNASAAFLNELSQSYQTKSTLLQLVANINDLKTKVLANEKILKIYTTALIPQAQGAYNSTRSSYKASRTSFLDLLDSERTLYRVKTGYYKSLTNYVHNIVKLESELGFFISNIDNSEVL